MSDLHLSLMGFGLLVIIGVVVYNWMQERKFRKIAQQRFQTPRDDVLMSAASADASAMPGAGPKVDIGSTTIGRATLNDIRIEPKLTQPAALAPEPENEIEDESEPAVEAPMAAAPVERGHKPEVASDVPAPIDPQIDYVVRLDFAEPVEAGALRDALGT